MDVAISIVVAAMLTIPANWLVRWVLRVVRTDIPDETNGAGRWIGILERLLIYVLVIAGQAAAAA